MANENCIKILNPDLTCFSSFGSYRASGGGQFRIPHGVACDSTGNVYVADNVSQYIQVFTAEGEYLRQFGKKVGGYEIGHPFGICIDREDVVYVTECSNHQVSLFKWDGTYMKSFGSKTYGSELGKFNYPRKIALDEYDNIYVTDDNNRIQIF